MDLTKVSPLPWSEKNPESWASDGIFGADGARVLSEEDRAYIVHACNNYPALVATLIAVVANRKCAGPKTCEQLAIDALKAAGEL
jgi:hypothetical protein